MIDDDPLALIPLKDAAAHCPRPVHYQTLRNWTRKGVRGVKLESHWIGGREFTSRSALKRFFYRRSAQQQPRIIDDEERRQNQLVREIIRAEFGV